MTLSEAIEAAGVIVGCYPNGGANAGESYIGALAATLGSYPKSVAEACAHRVNGVARDCKFMPTVADVVAWCEKKTEPLRLRFDRNLRIFQQLADRERVSEPQSKPGQFTYAEFLEYAKQHGLKARPIGRFE